MIWITIQNMSDTISFYTSTRRLHESQHEYYYDKQHQQLIPVNDMCIKTMTPINYQRIFIFTDDILPFFLKKVPGKNSYWGFSDIKRPKLYRLAIIIWPPAYRFVEEIINSILFYNSYYRIANKHHFHVPPKQFLSFIYNVYKGDRRCDKSQLPWKWDNMKSSKNQMVYFDLYVPKARIGSNMISKTAIEVKYFIRKKFKYQIPNYVHDIIIHIADNSSHSKNMYQYVKSYQT